MWTFSVPPLSTAAALYASALARAGTAVRGGAGGQYGVSVYPQHLAALEQAGALEHLEDGSVVLRDIGLYTQTTGLTLEPSGGNALFIG